MKIEGYGKRYPVADNSTEEGRRQNRRVELLIIVNDSTIAYPDAYESIQGLFNSDLYPAQGGANDLITPPVTEPQTPEQVAEQVQQAMEAQAAEQAQPASGEQTASEAPQENAQTAGDAAS